MVSKKEKRFKLKSKVNKSNINLTFGESFKEEFKKMMGWSEEQWNQNTEEVK